MSAGNVTAYRTLARGASAEIVEKGSRFRCALARVEDTESARAFVAAIQQQYGDARHHCHAFVIGPSGEQAGSHDGGEPPGTAGPPILDALTGSGLGDLCAVVSRWFGGVLLGTGGLARAYGDATRAALAEVQPLERVHEQVLEVFVDMVIVGRLEHALRARGARVLGVEYDDQAVLRLAVPQRAVGVVREAVAEVTAGESTIRERGAVWVDAS